MLWLNAFKSNLLQTDFSKLPKRLGLLMSLGGGTGDRRQEMEDKEVGGKEADDEEMRGNGTRVAPGAC